MFAGMLRFVCTNSLVAGERFEDVRVPPKGNIQHDIIEGVYTVAEDFPRLIDASETIKENQLRAAERRVKLGRASCREAWVRTVRWRGRNDYLKKKKERWYRTT